MAKSELEQAVTEAKAELDAARKARDEIGQHRDHSRAGAAPVAGGYVGNAGWDAADARVDAARAAHIVAVKALRALGAS